MQAPSSATYVCYDLLTSAAVAGIIACGTIEKGTSVLVKEARGGAGREVS